VLFIGTQFSNLYTAVDTPAKGRVCVCVVFVFACKYVLGHSRVSKLFRRLMIRCTLPRPLHLSGDTLEGVYHSLVDQRRLLQGRRGDVRIRVDHILYIVLVYLLRCIKLVLQSPECRPQSAPQQPSALSA
jgi:hypothetical protein